MTIIEKSFFLALFAQALFPFYMMTRLYKSRKKAVSNKEVSFSYFRSYQGDEPLPEEMAVNNRHYTNLFEMPVYFLIYGLACLVLSQVDLVAVILAWLYVALRLMHSIIHLGGNDIMARAKFFAASSFVLIASWIYLTVKVLVI